MNRFEQFGERTGGSERPIVGAGVGCGMTARSAVAGGADFLGVYHTAIYRISGLPTVLSLFPYDDCNKLALRALPQILANAAQLPVLVGLGAHDPRQPLERLVGTAQELGAWGVINEPFCGAYGTMVRKALESSGLGFPREREMLRCALSRGMLALGWAFSPEEAAKLASDGVPLVGAMVEESVAAKGHRAMCDYIVEVKDRVKQEQPDAKVLIHGHPLEQVSVVRDVLQQTGVDGYFTGSAGERLPAEQAVAAAISDFKTI